MATGSMVPMIDKNGNGGLIPHDQVENALRDPEAGFEVGFHLVDKNGNHGIVPASKLRDALNDKDAGFKIFQASQDKTHFEQERTHDMAASTVGHFAKEAANLPLGILGAAGQAMDPFAGAKTAAHLAENAGAREAEGRNRGYNALATVGEATGIANARGMEEAANVGDTGGVLGTALADAGAAAAAPKLMERFKAATEARNEARIMDRPAAAKKLTNAFNFTPEDMPKAEKTYESHIGRITKAAEQNGINLKEGGRAEVLDATRKASADHQELYNKQLLDPIKDRRVLTDPESGGRADMTYGESEQRLRHLNDLINYDEGLKAEGETQLARKAEANQLRDTLNKGMARDLGIKPAEVAEARSAGEQLRWLANKSELAMNLERYANNAQERGNTANVHATPHGAYLTTGGRVGRVVNRAMEGALGHPGDNLVRDVFSNLRVEPAPPKLAVPNVAAADRENAELANTGRPAPDLTPQQKRAVAGVVANKVMPEKPQGATATIAESLKASQRHQADRAAARERRAFEQKAGRLSKAAERDVNRKAHGKYKTRSEAAAAEGLGGE